MNGCTHVDIQSDSVLQCEISIWTAQGEELGETKLLTKLEEMLMLL